MPSYTRTLGARSGIQVNSPIDNTQSVALSDADQAFGIIGRFERGRIDKAFPVTADTLYAKLGQPSAPSISRLNEAFIHIYEAFAQNASAAVVSRLASASAALSLMVLTVATGADSLGVKTALAAGDILSIKHMECFNDGIRVRIHANAATDSGGAAAPSKWVRVQLVDVQTKKVLYDFEGSLDPQAKDEFNNTTYLPLVVSSLTDNVVIAVASSVTIPTTATCYGQDSTGVDKWLEKDLQYFSEGGTTYATAQYDAAVSRLRYSNDDFGYIAGGGTQAKPLISRLLTLGFNLIKQVKWDIPGDLTPDQAIAFVNDLSIDTQFSEAFWAPLYCDDPVNGGKDFIGASGINVGKACYRNSQTNNNGIAPKNFPIGGKNHPLSRTGVVQMYTPSEPELNNLAKARINPVIFQRYTTGGLYVFTDILTGKNTTGALKLTSVAEMSGWVDVTIANAGQEFLLLPMETAIKRMTDFLQELFEALQAAKWIKPSQDLAGASYKATVKANANRPFDRMDVDYWLCYDGAVRAIYQQQTLAKP